MRPGPVGTRFLFQQLSTRANYVTFGVFVASATLSIALVACYPFYQNTPLHLTLQRPFTSWGDLRAFYKGLAGQPVMTPADNLTARVMGLAWCDYVSPRPQIAPANRSASCSCLYARHLLFLANSTSDNLTYSPAACNSAGDDSVGCLRYRSTWNVWACGADCKVHPIVLALTCNLGLTVLSLSALLGTLQMRRPVIWAVSSLPAIAGIGLLLAIRPVQNFLFVMITAAVWVGTVLGLNIEISPQAGQGGQNTDSGGDSTGLTAHPAALAVAPAHRGGGASLASAGAAAQRAQRALRAQRIQRAQRARRLGGIGTIAEEEPETFGPTASLFGPDELSLPPCPIPIVTCIWFCQPLTLSAVSAYLAVAHTVRDVVGVLCFATLGYLAGLMVQRIHWARCFLVFGADGGGWALPRHLARAIYKWIVRCLGLGLAGVWVALFTLAYTNWLGASPYAAAPVSLVLLVLSFLVSAGELTAAVFTPALGSIGRLGWLELGQIALTLLCHGVFAVTAIVDGARG